MFIQIKLIFTRKVLHEASFASESLKHTNGLFADSIINQRWQLRGGGLIPCSMMKILRVLIFANFAD